MDISIIIVNWNSAAYVRKCLTALSCNSRELEIEVIIVDNASFDECREIVAKEFPWAIFIQSKENLGFAKANNLGAARATGAKLLFLNPDTEVVGDALSQMVSVFSQRADAGAVGCTLLNTDGSIQISCIQPFPTILNQALNAEVVLRAASKVGVWGLKPLFSNVKDITPVDAISGACLMVSKDAFSAVGGFSLDYFMYSEDIDLCHKMKQAGFVNYYISSVSVTHYGGGSSNQRKEGSYAEIQMRESVFKFLRRTRGGFYASGYRLTMFVVAIARIGLIAIFYLPTMCIGRFSSRRFSFMKWVGILRWSLALEKWTQ
jgi:N-acetylglucosaminyl-diphospho-decaprenol L-rhamnosyltransferase